MEFPAKGLLQSRLDYRVRTTTGFFGFKGTHSFLYYHEWSGGPSRGSSESPKKNYPKLFDVHKTNLLMVYLLTY